jgi:hypothetical protein
LNVTPLPQEPPASRAMTRVVESNLTSTTSAREPFAFW